MLGASWNVLAHDDAREGKWRGNWRMEWVTSTLHTTSEHGVSGITTADAHTSAVSSRLNWRPCRFKWTRPFRRKQNLVSTRVSSHFKRSLQPILNKSVLLASNIHHLRQLLSFQNKCLCTHQVVQQLAVDCSGLEDIYVSDWTCCYTWICWVNTTTGTLGRPHLNTDVNNINIQLDATIIILLLIISISSTCFGR